MRDVSLAALRLWLAVPGSDVEKALKKAMRAKHHELNQAMRAAIAQRVLGVAVFRGRLEHLLKREEITGRLEAKSELAEPTEPSCHATLLLELFVRRELRGKKGNETENEFFAQFAPAFSVEDERKLSAAAKAPFFEPNEQPELNRRLAAVWSLPLWMAESWLQQFGLEAFQLARAMCCPARVTLRVNTFKTSRLELMEMLMEHGIRSVPTAESPFGLWLPDGRPPRGGVWQLPGYSEGLFEVQDEGSQLLALATEAKNGDYVIDYCAGRGGKTWLLASLVAPTGRVCAWDIEEDLRKQLHGTRAKRAGASDLVHVPNTKPEGPEEMADIVLVDAPCSSSGVLRRHPSQRWALRHEELSHISALQLSILEEASQLVRSGGRLVYATCSLLHAENGAVVEAFEAGAFQRGFARWPFRNGRLGLCGLFWKLEFLYFVLENVGEKRYH